MHKLLEAVSLAKAGRINERQSPTSSDEEQSCLISNCLRKPVRNRCCCGITKEV